MRAPAPTTSVTPKVRRKDGPVVLSELMRLSDTTINDAAFGTAIRDGFRADQPYIHPKWRWDAKGSQIFEEITKTPEYYPFSREQELLHQVPDAVRDLTNPTSIIELGSGSSEKTQIVLDGLKNRQNKIADIYTVDVSESALLEARDVLADRYRDLNVQPVVADFTSDLDQILQLAPTAQPKLVLFLGGTIGNLNLTERSRFYQSVAKNFAPGDLVLIGASLKTDIDRMLLAYDDPAGVAARFNLNLIERINRELAGNLPASSFKHMVKWNSAESRIEGFLQCTDVVDAYLKVIDMRVKFSVGDEIITDLSGKFVLPNLADEMASSGLAIAQTLTDANATYGMVLAGKAK